MEEIKILIDAFFKLYQEQCTQGRHHETQRSAVITATIAIAAAIIAVISNDKLITRSDIYLTSFLIIVGIFSAAFSVKHYQLFEKHMKRAKNYRDALDNLLPVTNVLNGFIEGRRPQNINRQTPILTLKEIADRNHEAEFPKLSNFHLHYWWAGICVLISIVGILLTAKAIFDPDKAQNSTTAQQGVLRQRGATNKTSTTGTTIIFCSGRRNADEQLNKPCTLVFQSASVPSRTS